MQMTSANSLKKCGFHLLGDLFGFRFINYFYTISGVMSTIDNVSLGKSSDCIFQFKKKETEVYRKDTHNRQRFFMVSICVDCEKE